MWVMFGHYRDKKGRPRTRMIHEGCTVRHRTWKAFERCVRKTNRQDADEVLDYALRNVLGR